MANTGRRIPLAAGNSQQAADPATGTDTVEADETRMRRALGLGGAPTGHTPQQRPDQARARHRFVQDGGVPVVMLHKPEPEIAALRERVAALQAALEAERSAHAATRRTLADQQAAHQALQTRLTHNDLAHAEALDAERRLRHQAEAAVAIAIPPTPRPAPEAAMPQPADPDTGTDAAAPSRRRRPGASAQAAASAPTDVPPRKRGRPRINPIPEPKPVRWWTPSFKAKNRN